MPSLEIKLLSSMMMLFVEMKVTIPPSFDSKLSLLYLNQQFVNKNENKGLMWSAMSGISHL